MTTNHAPSEWWRFEFFGSPVKWRFSDYYNDNWSLSTISAPSSLTNGILNNGTLPWNLLAECIQLYLRFGVVEAPSERIEITPAPSVHFRRLPHGSDGISPDQDHFGTRIPRKVMQEAFFENSPDQRKLGYSYTFQSQNTQILRIQGLPVQPARNTTRRPVSLCSSTRTVILTMTTNQVEWNSSL